MDANSVIDGGVKAAGSALGAQSGLGEVYAAVARGDMAALGARLAPNVIGHEYGGGIEPRVLSGREAILGRLGTFGAVPWEMVTITAHASATTSSWAAAIATGHASSPTTGNLYALPHVMLAHLDEQGCLNEVWLIYDRPRLVSRRPEPVGIVPLVEPVVTVPLVRGDDPGV
jgi:hypothetical protein